MPCAAGVSKPATPENDTVYDPGASLTQLRPHWSMGIGVLDPPGVTEMRGPLALVVTRRYPKLVGPDAPGLETYVPVIMVVAPALTFTIWHAGAVKLATRPKHTWCEPVG